MEFRVTKAQQQYIHEIAGMQFVDCISNHVHVGHSHPQVVSASQRQMNLLMAGQGFYLDQLELYVKQLVSAFPEKFSICYLVNSRSEANDLAIRLAKEYTKNTTFAVLENSDHGHFQALRKISPITFSNSEEDKGDTVVLPVPYVNGRTNHEVFPNDGGDIIDEALQILNNLQQAGQTLAGFISEPVLVSHGVLFPPKNYYKEIYAKIHSMGGVTIGDESNCGLGRLGDCFWGFRLFEVFPDIVTIGTALGNGYPMAAVITTKEISGSLDEYNSTYGGNPVSCAIGSTVLSIIEKEKLMISGTAVGRTLLDGLVSIQCNYPCVSEVRGMGLCIGIEIVDENAKHLAEMIVHRLKMKHYFILGTAPSRPNVIMIKPPMCFNQQNARGLLSALNESIGHFQKEKQVFVEEECGRFKKRKFDYADVD